MPLFTQNRFPRLWLLMQKAIGGNASKQQLAIEYYRGQARVLEIGCSVGNVSAAFLCFPGLSFTGLDIDSRALALARRRFRGVDNFRFVHGSLNELAQRNERFDYVLFAGILHHVDDATGEELLRDAMRCTETDSTIVIYEPEALRDGDGWFLRFFYSLFEQGAHLRSRSALEALVKQVGIEIQQVEDRMISPGVVQRPYVARFNLLVGRPVDRLRGLARDVNQASAVASQIRTAC